VHLLPCDISSAGPANVAAYFQPTPLPEYMVPPGSQLTAGDEYVTCAFRGRQVTGVKRRLPSSLKGLVLRRVKEKKPPRKAASVAVR
jgi:hypothetical protein